MKKVLSYILISFIISANLLAPFSVERSGKISKNEVWADDGGIKMTVTPTKSNSEIKIAITAKFQVLDGTVEGARVQLKDVSGNILKEEEIELTSSNEDKFTKTGNTKTLIDLSPNTKYYITTEVRQIARLQAGLFQGIVWNFHSLWVEGDNYNAAVKEGSLWSVKTDSEITTLDNNTQSITEDSQTVQNSQFQSEDMPICGIETGEKIKGCIAQAFYYVLYVPTSYLFALSGIFFDNTFAYSVQDSSYRSAFVVQGWGLVRDFCNLFFIFILLYVAIGTILDLPHFNTKGTIINVVIIGLLINFSLFATQVIIDASNITARVFYNADTIKISTKSNTGASDWVAKANEDGVLPISAALVNKINPQNIILQAKQINNIPVKGGGSGFDAVTSAGIGVGSFITIVILATIANVVGFIVFLSVGLIFVSRVIGLWIAMILAPLAFFTYIIPETSGMKMVGWKNWWPDTLKMAFLAPVFMFFMYIILKFLELNIISDPINTSGGLAYFASILIPLAFISILMLKAKSIASDMSGEMGKQITGFVSAGGGAILGGAALGTAFLGRRTIGAFMKGAATGESSNQRFARGESRNNWDKIKGAVTHYGTLGLLTKAQQAASSKINADQARVEGSVHARQTLNETAQTRYHKKYEELTQTERQSVHDTIDRNILSREHYGNRAFNQLTNTEQAIINADMVTRRAAHNIAHGSEVLVKESHRKQGVISNLVQSSRNGSFDVRNLSKLIASDQDSGLNKLATGLTSTIASGMRGAIKQANVNYGEGQKDFIKDLGHTITESLKSTKIKVDLSHVGEEKKEDSHGGGGHH